MATIDDRIDLETPGTMDGSAGKSIGSAVASRPDLATRDRTPAEGTMAAPNGRATRRGLRRTVVLPVLAAVVIAVGYFGYGFWQDQALYVSTDNASIGGSLVQVGSLNAGRVASVAVDVGDRVSKDQVLATVTLPSALSTTASGTPKMGFRGTDDQVATVQSPIDGVVVARSANPGDTVGVGQPVLTIVDPSQLYVQAQIDETKAGRLRIGQPVEVSVDSLGQTLPGQVVAIDRATAATFSLLPQGNTSGNFTKVTQLVPVRIALDYGQAPLVLGASVEVRIRVEE